MLLANPFKALKALSRRVSRGSFDGIHTGEILHLLTTRSLRGLQDTLGVSGHLTRVLEAPPTHLTICSISGPGGVGKSYFLHHVLETGSTASRWLGLGCSERWTFRPSISRSAEVPR